MHVWRKSDALIVPRKRANEDTRLEEFVEERRATKENSRQAAALRTQCRVSAPSVLSRVREAAKRGKEVQFTALLHREHLYNASSQRVFATGEHPVAQR